MIQLLKKKKTCSHVILGFYFRLLAFHYFKNYKILNDCKKYCSYYFITIILQNLSFYYIYVWIVSWTVIFVDSFFFLIIIIEIPILNLSSNF